jgi:glyoxylase-like metal-dependent hydrolase (beta-lactamase superfamily II)
LAAKESTLEAVIDTHAHADHISGGPALAAAYGVPYYLHPYDAIHPVDMLSIQVPYAMLAEGQQFKLGDLTVEILHMPGHTLGQVNVLIQDEGSASYLLTGDMVFLNGFGRPDMGGHSDSWAQLAYKTLFTKFKKQISPDTLILPGHYADFAEANGDGLFVKTMTELWQLNSCLHFDSEASFREYAACYATQSPTHYIDIKRVDMGLRQLSEAQLSELELGKNACALTR